MVQDAIEANFTCNCGAPLVVLTLERTKDNKVSALVVCPRHRSAQPILLDHSALNIWAKTVADRVYRCALCGQKLDPVAISAETESDVTFTLSCPKHGIQNNTRNIWRVLHKRLLNEVRELRGTKPMVEEPPKIPPIESGLGEEARPAKTRGFEEPVARFCENCGNRFRPGDGFCLKCGHKLD